jgi:hypothetical protein
MKQAKPIKTQLIVHVLPDVGADAGCDHIADPNCACDPELQTGTKSLYPVYRHRILDRVSDCWRFMVVRESI